jgi:hypothetical protein
MSKHERAEGFEGLVANLNERWRVVAGDIQWISLLAS